MELFVTNQKTLEEDGWLPGPYEIKDDHEDAGKIKNSADRYIESLLEFNPDATEQLDVRDRHLSSMEHLGGKARKGSLDLIDQILGHFPVIEKQLDERAWLSGNFNDIQNLSQDLDPLTHHVKDEGGPRLLDRIPFIRTPISRYLSRFEVRRNDTLQLVGSLEKVADVFEKDMDLFKAQIRAMADFCTAIARNIYLGNAIAQGLHRALESDVMPDDPRREFIEKEQIPRIKTRMANLKLQLDLNRSVITTLTIVLLNTESLYKAVQRLRKDLATAFNMGTVVVRDRINLSLQPVTFGDEETDRILKEDSRPGPQPFMSLAAAFARTTDLAGSAKDFMKKALAAFKDSAEVLPELQKRTDKAFQSAKPLDPGITQDSSRP